MVDDEQTNEVDDEQTHVVDDEQTMWWMTSRQNSRQCGG